MSIGPAASRRLMSAWCVRAPGARAKLQLIDNLRSPTLEKAGDILVDVDAFSVNPIDVKMAAGYGEAIFSLMRRCATSTSNMLILGRDFCGTVIDAGPAVTKCKPGDQVYGSVPLNRPGAFAERLVVDQSSVAQKPKSLDPTRAAALPYAVNSCWIPLVCLGRLRDKRSTPSKVFINGASGGVGTFAVQLCKAYNASVVASGSQRDALQLLLELGADDVIDYALPNAVDRLNSMDKFDIVLNLARGPLAQAALQRLKDKRRSVYATLLSPLVENVDKSGLPLGLLQSGCAFTSQFVQHACKGQLYTWTFFWPDGDALHSVAALVDSGKIKPVLSKTYLFQELPQAMATVEKGKSRGKIVVSRSGKA